MFDGVEADGPEMQGLLHRRMQIANVKAFQQPQHLHILAPAALCHARFHQATQCGELSGQVPALQGCCLIQRVDLLLDQRQVCGAPPRDQSAFCNPSARATRLSPPRMTWPCSKPDHASRK
jgi:hypothetical protein